MFGCPGLDAGLNTSLFGGDMAIPMDETRRIFLRLVYESLDETSFQSYNLFRTMENCAINAKSSIIQKFPKSISIGLEM